MADIYLVFVHGWSVTDLSTYGELPLRLRIECSRKGIDVAVRDIWLGQYISFHDEVQVPDISRAFEAAVRSQLADLIKGGNRFVCITHSTGAPVVRDWWQRYYQQGVKPSPMSHLIMLAPANFGSALAQLGKSKLSQLKFFLQGVQPGQGVLDWLELGSAASWELNRDWILETSLPTKAPNGFYPFALIGQSIDRSFYDHLNKYTGELGSDGVVRSAAANLNATLITIRQTFTIGGDGSAQPAPPAIDYKTAPTSAFRIVPGRSHSGTTMGIMNSVTTDPATDTGNQPTVDSILSCIQVTNDQQYADLCTSFAAATDEVQKEERLELLGKGIFALNDRYFIHDRFCMVIFRVSDSEGYPVTDYQLIFTAGEDENPNHLPEGFFADRQQNHLHPETVTYFVNYDILNGSAPVTDGDGKVVRPAGTGIDRMGLIITARPDKGFVRYIPLQLSANEEFFRQIVKPNATILIDIQLERLVSNQVFLNNGPIDTMPGTSFKDIAPGNGVLG
jgi:hypothetical protein